MARLLDKLIGEAVGTAIPGGKLYYKTLSKGVSFISKVIQKKKTKAEAAKAQAEQRIAQLKSLDFQGLQNAGVDRPYTGAQAAVFGKQESETKPAPKVSTVVDFEELDKDGNPVQKQNENKMMNMEWIKKNWYYLAGGAAVLYYVLKKKRR